MTHITHRPDAALATSGSPRTSSGFRRTRAALRAARHVLLTLEEIGAEVSALRREMKRRYPHIQP
jgi:hypothetical protein